MKTTRRVLLKHGGIALMSAGLLPGLGPAFLQRAAYAEERDPRRAGGRKTLVCIFQRGAVDGMSMVVPHGDPDYYNYRSQIQGGIAIQRTGEGGVVDLDGMFGLHPALSPLKPIYDAGHLAIVHAVGSPNPTRSHFDAQDFMESGVAGDKSVQDGWLARVLRECPEDRARRGTLRAVAMTGRLPRSLEGDKSALAMHDLRTFGFSAPTRRSRYDASVETDLDQAFRSLYAGGGDDIVHASGHELFAAMKQLQAIRTEQYVPSRGALYPRSPFGLAMQQIAQLVKANVGLEIAFADTGGWDTHVNQGGAQGQLARRLDDLAHGMAAFYADLGDTAGDVVVLTMSEFGRTARQNGNGGTDHGHGTCFFVLGGPVDGGKVHGQWPGLASERLYQNRDLAVTTDFRDVFGEVAARHLGVQRLTSVFPEYACSPSAFRGVLRK